MYWDPDCDGSTSGIPRWILDRDAPHQDMSNDLDDDGLCEYLARVDSEDRNRPPAEATWTMTCNGEQVQRVLTMGTTTTTSTRTKTTTTAGASTSMTHLGEVETFSMHGACDEKAFLNGAVFEAAGATRDGRPFYKARGQETYIYYDADCDGNGTTQSARWLVDDTRPSTTASMDLDQDGQCQYHARIDSDDPHPPRNEVWNVYCGGVSGWSEIELTLHEEGHVPPPRRRRRPSSAPPSQAQARHSRRWPWSSLGRLHLSEQ
eukprot:SRR837773.3266.p1 GENE.SRR837773.3266~~SRR837773.3266.p1  ORF type:complete len:307 (-),score=90.98 SRR837773.3266:80-865(-)